MTNRVVSWLEKYGLTILKDAAIVIGIGATATSELAPNSASAQKASDTLTSLANIVTQVEAGSAAIGAPGLTSAQKLQMAAALANQELQQWFESNLPGSPKVQDQQQWETGVATIVNGIVALLNSAEPNVETSSGVAGSTVPTAATTAPLSGPAPAAA